ncbi:hypothetical protein PR048_002104 [Dryococelus australis]|uniref:HAT C-terminal dimerisation domain-containing protein n=1 Tax=Dryococelus australis TaxID=614101 RepID=A0ABQ9IJD9_9NEOP|nr:hypothetical protein PR048_002104 [Dryococelus australis]
MSSRRTSDIWNHFSEVPSEHKTKSFYCSREISFVSYSSGTLCRHMKNRHSTVNFLRAEVINAHPDDQQHDDVSVQNCVDDNSTYDMVSGIIIIKVAVISTLAIVNPELNVLTIIEWDILQRAAEVLHIFSEVTTEINAENSVSQATSTRGSKKVCIKLTKQLKKCLKDCESNELYAQTILLDPRFKKFGFTDNAKYEAAYTQLEKKVCPIRGPAAKTNTELLQEIVATASHSQSSLWKSSDMTVQKLIPCDPTAVAAVIVETDKYMQEPLRLEYPLEWWRHRKYLYPCLYELVQRRSCIIPMSVLCERIFSKAGQTITERNCLSSSKTSKLLFLHSNMK